MRIGRIGFEGKSVVVLGAGATRGASFVPGRKGSLPPLDGDFFTQAQRLGTGKPKELLPKLIEDAVSLFGNDFTLTMEGYLTRLEQLSHVLADYRSRGRPPSNRFQQMRSDFLQVLAALLDESIGRQPFCEYHTRLVNSLDTSDAILSLNYDWLIDETLKRHGGKNWNPGRGYGVPVYVKGKKGAGARYWSPESYPASRRRKSINLLKLHGSMNWFPVPVDRKQPRLELRTRWWHQKGKLKFEIAPPEWNKPTRSGVYLPVWRHARQALREATAIIFVGYSLPETDLPVQALLTVEKKPKPLGLLITVNPDQSARKRMRSVLKQRLDRKTRVLSFDTAEDFHSFLDEE